MGCGASKTLSESPSFGISGDNLIRTNSITPVKYTSLNHSRKLIMDSGEGQVESGETLSVAKPPGKVKPALDHDAEAVDVILTKLHEIIPHLLEVNDYTDQEVLDDIKILGTATKYNPNKQKREKIVNTMVDLGIVDLFQKVWEQLHLKDDFPGKYSLRVKNMFRIFWNGTDFSAYMRQVLIEKNFIKFIFTNIFRNEKFEILEEKGNNTKVFVVKAGMGILHNLLQHCDVLESIRAERCVEVMEKYRSSSDSMIQYKAVILLSYILDESESAKLGSDDKNISFILATLKSCLADTESHYSKKYGYSASEVVQTLNLMAVNDGNKELIVNNGGLPLYQQMLEDGFSRQEQTLAAKGLWTLGFSEKVKGDIKTHPGCLQKLEHLSKSGKSVEVKRAAQGALWVIKDHKERTGSQLSLQGGITTHHVMISYQWDTKPIMTRVRDQLKQAGYKVWMDIDNMGGSTLEAMADAVEQAAVVLIAMSRRYKESPSCRTEAEYTYQLRKDFVPLRLQLNYKADGWLGIMVGTKLWFDFAKPEKFQASVNGLIRELGDRGRSSQNSLVVKQASEPLETALSPLAQVPVGAATWRESEVSKWLGEHGLGSHIKKFSGYDGVILLELRDMLLTAPEFFYTTLKKDMSFSLLQILKIQKALKSLQ